MTEPMPSSTQTIAEPSQLGPTTEGSVLLDIGGHIGALIISVPADMAGTEIEISPRADDHARTHVAVRERRSNHTIRYAAVFPGLAAGEYTVWAPRGGGSHVIIEGGHITQLNWPEP